MRKQFYMVFLVLSIVLFGCQSIEGDAKSIRGTKNSNNENITNEDKSESANEVNEIKEENSDEKELSEGSYYVDALSIELEHLTEGQGELSDESYDFILSNNRLFPAKNEGDINKAKEQAEELDVRLLSKNLQPYLETIVSLSGEVVQIEEETYDNGETAAVINLIDDNWNNHIILFFKSTGDILEGDQVNVIALPLTNFTYPTLDGGSQNAIMYFGSHAEK